VDCDNDQFENIRYLTDAHTFRARMMKNARHIGKARGILPESIKRRTSNTPVYDIKTLACGNLGAGGIPRKTKSGEENYKLSLT
jgi:hypothetical protein